MQLRAKQQLFKNSDWILFTIFPLSSPSAHSEISHFRFPPPPLQNQQNNSEWANFGPFFKFLEWNSLKIGLSSNLCALELFLSFFFIQIEVTCQITKRTNLKTYHFLPNLGQKTSKNGQNWKNGSFCPTFLAPITTQMEEKCLIYSYIWSRKYTKYIKYKKKRKSKIPPFFHSGSKLLIVWGLAPPCTIINLLRIGARMGIPPPPQDHIIFF